MSRRCGLPADIPAYSPTPLGPPLEEGMRRTRPANDHRGGCSVKDYEIRSREGAGWGVERSQPDVDHVKVPTYRRTCRVEGTEVHCAFMRL